jgi:hypothetical protein
LLTSLELARPAPDFNRQAVIPGVIPSSRRENMATASPAAGFVCVALI